MKLKPCPFCGGKAHIMKMGYPHWVYCESCGAKVHGGVFGEAEGEKASAKLWNKRQLQIIRCKDCKYGTKFSKPLNEGYEIYCENQCIESAFVDPDWFCADGKRRD